MSKKAKIITLIIVISTILSYVSFSVLPATQTSKEIPTLPNSYPTGKASVEIAKTSTIKEKTTDIFLKNTANVTVLFGEEKVNLSVSPNTIFYNALMEAKNAGKITFSGKNYPGLGFFVTDFGELHAGSGKDLLYYINSKEANVGVSSYVLKDGDVIEWKLE
jgi:hypothetical protein